MISLLGDKLGRRFVSGLTRLKYSNGCSGSSVIGLNSTCLSGSTGRYQFATLRWYASRRISCRISQRRPSRNPTTSATNNSNPINMIRSLSFGSQLATQKVIDRLLGPTCLPKEVRESQRYSETASILQYRQISSTSRCFEVWTSFSTARGIELDQST